ncbi:hypothetical protein CTA2_5607 [Colletotrichum tanaceti]|uniref:Uncharacterized protein n=1 Tax=Colletotrichum tanaceti TaxID=1306861 RepID=A0A4U6X716_9PEZI|nr:hypothetical protein CTA2_5607 [Colletotrichum tanaceti]TKW50699.1 hypothetical protein CTA1_10137 [Colletotrichum tanaceti]
MASMRPYIYQPALLRAAYQDAPATMPPRPTPLPAHVRAGTAAAGVDPAALEALHGDLETLGWRRRNEYFVWWGDFAAKLRRRQVVLENHRRGQGAMWWSRSGVVAYPALDRLRPGEEGVLDTIRGIVLRAEALLAGARRCGNEGEGEFEGESESGCVVDFALRGLRALEGSLEGVEVFCEKDAASGRIEASGRGTCWRYLDMLARESQ